MKCEKCGVNYLKGLDYCLFCDGVKKRNPHWFKTYEEYIQEASAIAATYADENVQEGSEKAEEISVKTAPEEEKSGIIETLKKIQLGKKGKIGIAAATAVVLVVLSINFVPPVHNAFLMFRAGTMKESDPYRAYTIYREVYESGDISAFSPMLETEIAVYGEETAKDDVDQLISKYGDTEEVTRILKNFSPETPMCSEAWGTYSEPLKVTFSVRGNGGEKIYIAVNEGDLSLYDGEVISLNQRGNYTIRAVSENKLGIRSLEASWPFDMQVPVPGEVTSNLKDGKYNSAQQMELSCADSESIVYTMDGSEPSEDSIVYTGSPILLDKAHNEIKAAAVNAAGTLGNTSTYEIDIDLPSPTGVALSLESGRYYEDQILEISQSDGTEIRYTMDGTTPNQNSALYTGPVTLGPGYYEIKAAAFNAQGIPGTVTEADYDITYQCNGPYDLRILASTWKNNVYVSREGGLYRYNRNNLNEYELIDSRTFRGLRAHHSYLYFYNDTGLYRMNLEDEYNNIELIIENNNIGSFVLLEDRIIFSSNYYICSVALDGTDFKEEVEISTDGCILYYVDADMFVHYIAKPNLALKDYIWVLRNNNYEEIKRYKQGSLFGEHYNVYFAKSWIVGISTSYNNEQKIVVLDNNGHQREFMNGFNILDFNNCHIINDSIMFNDRVYKDDSVLYSYHLINLKTGNSKELSYLKGEYVIDERRTERLRADEDFCVWDNKVMLLDGTIYEEEF